MRLTITAVLAFSTLALAASVLAQTEPPPSPQTNRSSEADMSDAAATRPKTGMEARMSGVSAGTVVQSPGGESIGTVKDIVPNSNTGQPDYVVIATRTGTTAVPYSAVVPLFHDGHIVLDRARLESSPRVSASQLQDNGSAEWKKKADRYWEALNPAALR